MQLFSIENRENVQSRHWQVSVKNAHGEWMIIFPYINMGGNYKKNCCDLLFHPLISKYIHVKKPIALHKK